MKTAAVVKSILSVVFILASAGYAAALDTDDIRPRLGPGQSAADCRDVLKECFILKGTAKTGCLYEGTRHYFCSGGKLASLVEKRLSLSPDPASIAGEKSAGDPLSLVDNNCLQNFDNHLSAKLLNGDYSTESLNELSGELDECRVQSVPDLMLPQ